MSKQFTATAILMLQREGKLKLSDPIGDYVDGLPDWGATVTLDQLMHHTSRIPDYWVELDDIGIGFSDAADQATTLDAIRRETRLEPGTGFLYSNSNYVLLAEVVAPGERSDAADFLAERIFTPLGLDMVRRTHAARPRHRALLRRRPEPAGGGLDLVRSHRHHHDAVGAGAVGRPVPRGRHHPGRLRGRRGRRGSRASCTRPAWTSRSMATSTTPDGWVVSSSDFTVSADRETVIAVMCNGHLSNRFGIAAALWTIWDPRTQ